MNGATVTGTYHYDEEKGMEIQVLKVEKQRRQRMNTYIRFIDVGRSA
ncbi:MAG: hypothetical protein ACLR8P_05155 [Clostridium fessum]